MTQETLMDAAQFDILTTRLTTHLTRRQSLGLLGLLGVAAGWPEEVDARKKRKGKKKGKKTPVCKDIGAECWTEYGGDGFTSMCCSGQCRDSVCCTRSGDPCPAGCAPNTPCAGCCLIDYCAASGVCA
jgi:hypothetical protein